MPQYTSNETKATAFKRLITRVRTLLTSDKHKPKPPCLFFLIPPELRLKIYDFTFTELDPRTQNLVTPVPPLLQVCQGIRVEAARRYIMALEQVCEMKDELFELAVEHMQRAMGTGQVEQWKVFWYMTQRVKTDHGQDVARVQKERWRLRGLGLEV